MYIFLLFIMGCAPCLRGVACEIFSFIIMMRILEFNSKVVCPKKMQQPCLSLTVHNNLPAAATIHFGQHLVSLPDDDTIVLRKVSTIQIRPIANRETTPSVFRKEEDDANEAKSQREYAKISASLSTYCSEFGGIDEYAQLNRRF
jgi:hypothetical protein